MQKLEKNAKAWAVTAWRLTGGDVVYQAADSGWVESFDDAAVYHTKAEADAALARANQDVEGRIVVGAYLFEVAEENGVGVPASVREKIRSKGPTDRTYLGKQAARP
jgi:hypothetical protein